MLPDYPPTRTSWLPASNRRSSPRALCLLSPAVQPEPEQWSLAAVSLAELGERGADPVRASERSPRAWLRDDAREQLRDWPRDGSRRGDRPVRPAPRCGLTPGTTELITWLEQRRAGPTGLGFRLDILALEDVELRLRDDLEIPLAEQRWLIELWVRGERLTHFQRLGLAPTIDQAAIRRAYLTACQRLHPDRYYGKHIGRFAPLLVELFHRAHVAQAYLADPRRCARYVAQLAAAGHADAAAAR